VARAGSRVIQNVRKSGKDAASQQWLNDDGVLTLSSNPKFVITIDGDANRDGSKITVQEKKPYHEKQKWTYLGSGDSRPSSPSPSRAESISVRPDNFPSSWFYIKSAASGLVVDIEHGIFTDPMKAGARAEMNHQKIDNGDGRHSLLELQLWRYEAGFLINRRTGFVLDIQGGTLKLAARVEAYNQHWFYENGFIANVYNSRLVLDIDGDGSKDGAKIAIGERKATANADQKWILEEVKFQWLATPAETIVERETTTVSTPPVSSITSNVLPAKGWFYIKSLSSGNVIDVDQGITGDAMAPNALVSMSKQVVASDGDSSKIESQLWRYEGGHLINRRSGLVLDCKQGVVRYGARLVQSIPKQGKEGHHQRWESVEGTLLIQGKPNYAIDIEGDGTKPGARLSLQRPKLQNNQDQQWEFQLAHFEFLQHDRVITRVVTEKRHVSTKVVPIQKDDWFFIKSGATGLVMDLEAGWITSATDVGAYISMRKQRSLDDPDKNLLERQLWKYEDGYFVNRRTNYVIDIYGRNAVVGVKLIQQHKASTKEEGQFNQLWNVVEGNIQLLHNPKLSIHVDSNKDGSRVQLLENKPASSTVQTWVLELAQSSSSTITRSIQYREGLEEARVTVLTEFPTDKWFYIKSKASNLVLDVQHGFFRDHTKPGTFLELNNQKLQASAKKHALLELQLWRFEDGYIINRRTNLVLDASQDSLKPGSHLIQWTRKTEDKASQLWDVTNGFIYLKSQPNLVLDVDGDGSREGSRISLNERKEKKNLDQRWSFEAVEFTWLSFERSASIADTDIELLKEYEATHLARVVEHKVPPTSCWFYLKSGISDLVLEPQHGRGVNHLKPGTFVQLSHQRLKSGKHSHALLELQLWRFDDGYIINRRTGLVLAVDKIDANASLIQAVKSTSTSHSQTQRWVIENGVISLASRKEFVIFLSYGRQGSRAFIRQARQGESIQSWSFAEVHFSWLTLDSPVTEQAEDEQLDVDSEYDINYLNKEKAQLRELKTFSAYSYFFIRTANGDVIDIDNGFGKNHMKVGAYASVHPQTTAASTNQHALLDIQLWTLKDGYLINKRTGLALTFEGDAKDGARLVQVLPKDAIKWSIEGGYIFPEQHASLALYVRDGYVVLVERSTATTWSIYEITLTWLIFTEVILLEAEKSEDFEFYEEFEETVLRSSTTSDEVIEYVKSEQHLTAPKESWFYLITGNKAASISSTYLLENGAEGASIELVPQKRFASGERHALLDLQLWKLEGSYLINRFTGLYLTIQGDGSLVLSKKQADATRQQWQFSEDGSISLVADSNRVIDFVNDKAILVERSSSKTVWLYNTVILTWITSLDAKDSYDVNEIQREITEYQTVYTRYIKYITTHTVTTTTVTRTRRIVRVHEQCSLEDATVLEKDGTVWACHLVEAGTGVDYVMQLLLNNTTNKYYIYVQWGSTEGQLEGPYETVDDATKEFQEIFTTKVGIEWSERENNLASGEQWTVVEPDYEVIEVLEERSEQVPQQGRVITRSRSQTLVDERCPFAEDAVVYKDSEFYHIELTQRSTGLIYTTQLLYNTTTQTYFVYVQWGENDSDMSGPYESAEVAKTHFKDKYREIYGVSWEDRNITNPQWAPVQKVFDFTFDDISVISGDEDAERIKVMTSITSKDTTSQVVETAKPSTHKESWFRKLAPAAVAGAVADIVLSKDNGSWKKTSNVVTTRKTQVDKVYPGAETSVVYFDKDSDVYNSVVTDNVTGVTYVTQLIYNIETKTYYVYYRYDETNYELKPYNTLEEAKIGFVENYTEKFNIPWTEHETITSERYTFVPQIYETTEVTEEIEETIDEEEAQSIITQAREVEGSKNEAITTTTTTYTTTATSSSTAPETTTTVLEKEDVILKPSESQNVIVETIVVPQNVEKTETVVETTTTHVTQPVVNKETSWFRKLAPGAEAGVTADIVLSKDNDGWKRTTTVVTTRKAEVDEAFPEAKNSVVYFDKNDDVYNSVVTDNVTGVTYVTQLIYNIETKTYYVYYRYDETNYELKPYSTLEEAKVGFVENYTEKFNVPWTEHETVTSERFTVVPQTYQITEVTEDIEEDIEEEEAQSIISRGPEVDQTTTTISTSTSTTTTSAAPIIVSENVQPKEDVVPRPSESQENVIVETNIEEIVKSTAVPESVTKTVTKVTGGGQIEKTQREQEAPVEDET
ncbi:hypothetical protein BGZ49_001021, partial [Haplosporangium sp. Z 27]